MATPLLHKAAPKRQPGGWQRGCCPFRNVHGGMVAVAQQWVSEGVQQEGKMDQVLDSVSGRSGTGGRGRAGSRPVHAGTPGRAVKCCCGRVAMTTKGKVQAGRKANSQAESVVSHDEEQRVLSPAPPHVS